jgi:hypothetical protein
MTFLRRYFLDKRFSQIAGSVKCSNAALGPATTERGRRLLPNVAV